LSCIRMLLSQSDVQIDAALHIAAMDDRKYEILNLLLKYTNKNMTCKRRTTLRQRLLSHFGRATLVNDVEIGLLRAAYSVQTLNIRIFMRYNHINLNWCNTHGESVLISFQYADDFAFCTRQLLNHPHIHINHMNNRGETALHAADKRKAHLRAALLTHGVI
jgi:hypothetical protein